MFHLFYLRRIINLLAGIRHEICTKIKCNKNRSSSACSNASAFQCGVQLSHRTLKQVEWAQQEHCRVCHYSLYSCKELWSKNYFMGKIVQGVPLWGFWWLKKIAQGKIITSVEV